MLNLSNILSLSRAGLALVFLQDNVMIRVLAIILAMVSDFLDGHLARLSKNTTQFGAILDPIMDKFFVFFVGGILYFENRLGGWELSALISRDVSLCLFGIFLFCARSWNNYECKALWWGKITTALQFCILIGLTLQFIFPWYVYLIFVLMAACAFLELIVRYKRSGAPHS